MPVTSRAPKEPGHSYGREKPRMAPPTPARSKVADLEETAATLGITFIPWQRIVGRYLYAVGPTGWQYPEAAAVVARQNGKTEILVPHIVTRLRAGRNVMHTAQDRTLPREVFERVVEAMMEHYRSEVRGKPRLANGQESIRTTNGGRYRIVAPTRSGARGPSNDDVIVDEVRELDDFDFIAAAEPTLTASSNPQMLYLSNAGEEDSVVLNSIRQRSTTDPALAYLEWSADPKRAASDRAGWHEANPSIGHLAGILPYLERKYQSHQLAGTLSIFETEHLCRWVITTRRRLVEEFAWVACAAEDQETATRFHLGVSMDPEGKRATAVKAWRQKDDTIALSVVAQITGEPFSVDTFGEEIRLLARGAVSVSFDPLTDSALARFVKKPKPEPVSGQKFSNASAQFTNLVNAGLVRWRDADAVTDDLGWTARKDEGDEGAYQAVRSDDEHPITAALAAIRAVWKASDKKVPAARVM